MGGRRRRNGVEKAAATTSTRVRALVNTLAGGGLGQNPFSP